MTRGSLWRSGLTVALVVAMAGSARADTAPVQKKAAPAAVSTLTHTKSPNWDRVCQESRAARQTCQLIQRVSVKPSGQLLLVMAVGYTGPNATPQMIFSIPLGTLLTQGIKVQFEKQGEVTLPVSTCIPAGCIATVDISAAQLAALSRTTEARVRYAANNGRPVVVAVQITGLADALTTLKP